MNIEMLREIFGWCTVLNGILYMFWVIFFMAAPDLTYRIQSKWFPMPRERFDVVFYCFLGAFKLLYIFFNVTPYLALLIIS